MTNRLKDPAIQIRIGLVFLVLASLWNWFVNRSGHKSSDVVDGVRGLLYGVSIGCMLLGIMRRGRLKGIIR